VARSLFWCASTLSGFLIASGLRAQSAPAPPTVIEALKNSAGLETRAQGLVLDDSEGLVVTVAASVDEKATFTCSAGGKTVAAKVAIFEANSRLLLLKPEAPFAAAPSKPRTAKTPLAPAERLSWFPLSGRQPAICAGPIQSLDGRALALTLQRVHFASSDLEAMPHPGTPAFNGAGEVAAFALSPLADSEGAWLCLPVEAARKVIADYRASGKHETGQLEFGIATGTTTPRIEFVKQGSRAEKAGLAAGDIVLEIAGRPITNSLDILDANFYQTSRNPVSMRVLRGIETLELTAPAVAKPK
jgi:serine protease Do